MYWISPQMRHHVVRHPRHHYTSLTRTTHHVNIKSTVCALCYPQHVYSKWKTQWGDFTYEFHESDWLEQNPEVKFSEDNALSCVHWFLFLYYRYHLKKTVNKFKGFCITIVLFLQKFQIRVMMISLVSVFISNVYMWEWYRIVVRHTYGSVAQ